jgi:uncharacterized membrane protein
MAASVPIAAPDITQDERTMATLAHALQTVGWWIAPLAIFVLRRNSRFVSFHALQALLLQLLNTLLIFTSIFIFFVVAIGSGMAGGKAAPPPAFFAVFMVIWLVLAGMGILVLLAAILYAIKAGRGEWAEYPVLGRLARNILHICPNEAYE